MSKDSAGVQIKEGDRVSISGVVMHAAEADSAPCQVLLDASEGADRPLVTFESRLLKVAHESTVKTDPPPAAPAAVSKTADK